MPIAQTDKPTSQKPLRLWPGVVAAVLLLLVRFGLKIVVPGFNGFSLAMQGGLLSALAIVVWWAFLSRAPRSERWGAIVLMIVALGATWRIKHESMGPLWLVGYAVPVLCLAFVTWAVASCRLSDRRRRATMVASILLACGAWTAVRTVGINGDHNAQFRWRWTASREEQLLAQAGDQPAIPFVNQRPEIYPEPEAFRPERFLEHAPDTYAWIPFGGGIRRCLGASFAQLEMRRVLHVVARRTSVRAAGSKPERAVRRAIIYPPAKGARVVLEEREPRAVPSAPVEVA